MSSECRRGPQLQAEEFFRRPYGANQAGSTVAMATIRARVVPQCRRKGPVKASENWQHQPDDGGGVIRSVSPSNRADLEGGPQRRESWEIATSIRAWSRNRSTIAVRINGLGIGSARPRRLCDLEGFENRVYKPRRAASRRKSPMHPKPSTLSIGHSFEKRLLRRSKSPNESLPARSATEASSSSGRETGRQWQEQCAGGESRAISWSGSG